MADTNMMLLNAELGSHVLTWLTLTYSGTSQLQQTAVCSSNGRVSESFDVIMSTPRRKISVYDLAHLILRMPNIRHIFSESCGILNHPSRKDCI